MSIDTYNNLKTEIQNYLDADNLADEADTFIDIAEARHKREVRINEMLTRANLTINDGDRFVNLPSDFLDIKYLRILHPTTGNLRRFLVDLPQLTTHQLTLKSTNCIQPPRFFAIHAGDPPEVEFDSEIDQDYTGEIFYYVELTALSGGNTTNSLLDRAPDVYLYAALAASAAFLINDERIAVWESLYAAVRDGVNGSQLESVRGQPLVSKLGAVP